MNVILASTSVGNDLSAENHSLALEYVNLILSIRDREELIHVLCKHHPDLLTPLARDLVTAYEPIIRAVHNAVDLSGTVYDTQNFLDDLIKLSKPRNDKASDLPSVEDYIKLLEKHQSSCHHFLHQAVKNGPEIREWYKAYGRTILAEFQTEASEANLSINMIQKLNSLFQSLSPPDQTAVRKEVDARRDYLNTLSIASTNRIKALLSHNSSDNAKTAFGPGVYLAHWQNLLDATALTPDQLQGPVRHGRDLDAKKDSRVNVDGKTQSGGSAAATTAVDQKVQSELGLAPDMRKTVALLSGRFWEVLREGRP